VHGLQAPWAAFVAASSVIVEEQAQGAERGTLLFQALMKILSDMGDVTLDEITAETLAGFCAEVERLLAGWGTGRDPLVNRTPNDTDDLPLGAPWM
jgi:hypothetical protein